MFPLKSDVPMARFPSVTLALIAANISVFVWQLSVGLTESIDVYGAIPRNILGGASHAGIPAALTLLTSMFLHGGFLHLGLNMLFFWVFGGNVEDRLGHFTYLVFYLVCGVLAGLAQMLAAPTSPTPMVGASGAIAGVLGAYFLLFPRSRIYTAVIFVIFVRMFYLPAVLFLGVWFLMQLFPLGAEAAGAAGGVAFAAHVGGFISGLVLVRLFAAVTRQGRLAT
jgi:membrane associated rhomboid family serine protease